MADLTPANPAPVSADTVRDQDKIMLILAYFSILCLIPLLTVKDSAYVKWHAKQGTTLLVVASIGMFALMIVSMILGAVVHVVGLLFSCMVMIAGLGVMGVAIMGMVKAVGGERWRIPVIADLADKF